MLKYAVFAICSLFIFVQNHQALLTGFKDERPPARHRQRAGIVWQQATLQRIAPPDSAAFYPRMIQLRSGILLAAYATNGHVVCIQSRDGGISWSAPALVAARRDNVNMDTPDLLQLKDGSILICYGTRPQRAGQNDPDIAHRYEVRIQKSADGGLSWTGEKTLYEAGTSFKDGCWEPALLQLPFEEVQLFFSDEGIYTTSDEQNISLLRSADNGGAWSAAPEIISFRKGSRDGMPVPLWLKKENRVVVAIEDPGHRNFKPYTIRSAAGGSWPKTISGDDADRAYALASPIHDSIYAGAPYLRQLSTGETVLSYQSTEGRARNRDNDAIMRVALGDPQACSFKGVTTPFNVPEGYHALWNSLCILKGDTIAALTSTNGYSGGRSEIWMIKGTVRRDLAK